MNMSSVFIHHDHLDQSSRCKARLTMSSQTNTGARLNETGRRVRPRLVAPIVSSNQEAAATKTSNLLSLNAIVKLRQLANDLTERQILSSKDITHTSNKMCNSPSRRADTTRQPPQTAASARPFRRSIWQTAHYIPTARTLTNYLLISLALILCVVASTNGATENEPTNQAKANQDKASSRDASERSDSFGSTLLKTASELGNSSSTSASGQRSIVASLSSAVASAAAAAAVAAAQNGLSGSDARSLSTSPSPAPSHKAPSQANRSPGLSNLAIKLVDTIPEVHYNILHNMKKLDHAAPFYNVPNKYSHGVAKESSQNFLANALTAAGAGDQISNLFRSPLWKRIADGYGDFASEFRSMFRPSKATPMRGPTSPTSKILRDISVPALLMLLASSIGNSEWRPVRTRRKSFRPVDIPAGSDIPPVSDSLLGDGSSSGTSQTLPPSSSGLESTMQPAVAQYFQRYERYPQPQVQQQQQTFSGAQNQQAGVGGNYIGAGPFNSGHQQSSPQVSQLMPRIKDDINLMAMESQRTNWIAPDQVGALLGGQTEEHHPLELQAGATLSQQHHQQQQQQQQALAKRSFELNGDSSQRHPGQAVEIVHGNEMLLGGDSDGPDSESIGKLLASDQPEVVNDGHQHRFSSLFSDSNGMTPIKRGDQLEYSLITPGDISRNEQATATKRQPALLSTMARAAASLLSSRSTSVAKSGSLNLADSSGRNVLAYDNLAVSPLLGGVERRVIDRQIMMRRQSSPAEQRDLTKLLPETWREVVKRTMTNVQQQANVQWKSIEGQLANWVQDKLKTVGGQNQAASAGSSSGQSSKGSSTSSISGVLPAPIGTMLSSASTSALNILGLEWKNQNSGSSSSASNQSAGETQTRGASKVDEQSGSPSAGDKGKVGSSSSKGRPTSTSKAALEGVANLIGSSLSPRNSQSSPEPTPLSPTTNDQSPSTSLHQTKQQTLSELASSVVQNAVSSITSKYPTLTGPDASSQASSSVPSGQTGSSSQTVASASSLTPRAPL